MTGVPLVQPGVLEVVTDHVNSAWARKVGGILLGRPIDDVTRVDAALPARQTDEYAGEIAFPPPVWEEAYAKLDEHPGSTIVGWYHSHPGSGVAMSDYDRRLHKVLFGEPFSVALVLDPVAERMAWFGWDIEQLWPLQSDEPAPAAAPVGVAAPGRGLRASVAALVALGILAGGAGGELSLVGEPRCEPPHRQKPLPRLHGPVRPVRCVARSHEVGEGRSVVAFAAIHESWRCEVAEARQAETVRYRIRPGDTLWGLARTFLGDGRRWPEILRANHSRITDPDRLLIGQVVDIPLGSGR